MEEIKDKQTKIWVCSRCKSIFTTRWLLARHLREVHHVHSKEASQEAKLSEWWRVYNPNLFKIQLWRREDDGKKGF